MDWIYPDGTPEQRLHRALIGVGQGIHWPDPGEDVWDAGILAGRGDRTKGGCAAAQRRDCSGVGVAVVRSR